MELAVLGPLEARQDGVVVSLLGGKPRAVLTRRLVETGQVVSVDALAAALRADAPPADITATIQVHVSNLRRAVGAGVVVTRPPGCAVATEGNDFDHRRLEAVVDEARRSRASHRLAAALELAQRRLAGATRPGDPHRW